MWKLKDNYTAEIKQDPYNVVHTQITTQYPH